jgi:NitT/TauT family transport system ATP-binding protein
MTRERLQEELLTIWRATGLRAVFVTQSLEEAIYLADRVVLISPGPGRIVAEERVTLDPPRDMSSPEFYDIRRHLASLPHANHAWVAA